MGPRWPRRLHGARVAGSGTQTMAISKVMKAMKAKVVRGEATGDEEPPAVEEGNAEAKKAVKKAKETSKLLKGKLGKKTVMKAKVVSGEATGDEEPPAVEEAKKAGKKAKATSKVMKGKLVNSAAMKARAKSTAKGDEEPPAVEKGKTEGKMAGKREKAVLKRPSAATGDEVWLSRIDCAR